MEVEAATSAGEVVLRTGVIPGGASAAGAGLRRIPGGGANGRAAIFPSRRLQESAPSRAGPGVPAAPHVVAVAPDAVGLPGGAGPMPSRGEDALALRPATQPEGTGLDAAPRTAKRDAVGGGRGGTVLDGGGCGCQSGTDMPSPLPSAIAGVGGAGSAHAPRVVLGQYQRYRRAVCHAGQTRCARISFRGGGVVVGARRAGVRPPPPHPPASLATGEAGTRCRGGRDASLHWPVRRGGGARRSGRATGGMVQRHTVAPARAPSGSVDRVEGGREQMAGGGHGRSLSCGCLRRRADGPVHDSPPLRRPDGAVRGCMENTSHRGRAAAVRPRWGRAGAQAGAPGAQDGRCVSLPPPDHRGSSPSGAVLDTPAHMNRRDRRRMHHEARFGGRVAPTRLQACGHTADENGAAAVWGAHHGVLRRDDHTWSPAAGRGTRSALGPPSEGGRPRAV